MAFRITLLLVWITLFASLPHAQGVLSFGAVGGFTSTQLVEGGTGDWVNLDGSPNLHAGVFGDIAFGPLAGRVSVVYVTAGSFYYGRGSKGSVEFAAVPFDLMYKIPLPDWPERYEVKVYPLIGAELRVPIDGLSRLGVTEATYAYNMGFGIELPKKAIGNKVFIEVRKSVHHKGFDPFGDNRNYRFGIDNVFLRLGIGI